MERPFVRGALYTGKGEGGVAATPGGQGPNQPAKSAATEIATSAAVAATTAALAKAASGSVFAQSGDHRPGGQDNLVVGANSPPWHAASPEATSSGGQQNAGALSGWKTKEFGGAGFNQLVFDDSNGQLRTQLATSQYASQLNLGYLIHQADNHRGSFRGLGFELRTDAYGALRGGRGLLLSSFGITPSTPSGDNAAGIALAAQMKGLLKQFSDQAKKHETVPFASITGSQSALSAKEAKAPALHTALKGMGDAKSFDQAVADAAAKVTTTGGTKVPQLTDPLVAISAKAGLAITSEDLILAAGEHVVLGAGQDLSQATGGSARIHTGQAIGILGGAVAPGAEATGTGVTLIAGQGDITVQAQAGTMQVAAKNDVSIQSQHGAIDWAAAKKITLRTTGGASVVIEGGNITVMCPGELRIKASVKKFEGPAVHEHAMPKLPKAEMKPSKMKFDLFLRATPGAAGTPLGNYDWRIVREGGSAVDRVIVKGRTGEDGKLNLTMAQELRLSVATARWPNNLRIEAPGIDRPLDIYGHHGDWTSNQQNLHALAALDHSDHPGHHPATAQSTKERWRAAEVSGELPATNFFKKIE